MLSFILGLVYRFEQAHACAPNRLYLNQHHYRRLTLELNGNGDAPQRIAGLGVQVLIHASVQHPRLMRVSDGRVHCA